MARKAALKCPMEAKKKCECKRPMDLAKMPMNNLTTYNYMEGGKAYHLDVGWGGSCFNWAAHDKTG